jgi:hypothetical protein
VFHPQADDGAAEWPQPGCCQGRGRPGKHSGGDDRNAETSNQEAGYALNPVNAYRSAARAPTTARFSTCEHESSRPAVPLGAGAGRGSQSPPMVCAVDGSREHQLKQHEHTLHACRWEPRGEAGRVGHVAPSCSHAPHVAARWSRSLAKSSAASRPTDQPLCDTGRSTCRARRSRATTARGSRSPLTCVRIGRFRTSGTRVLATAASASGSNASGETEAVVSCTTSTPGSWLLLFVMPPAVARVE